MYAQAEKPKQKKSKAIANSVARKQSSGKSQLQFVENRHEAVATRIGDELNLMFAAIAENQMKINLKDTWRDLQKSKPDIVHCDDINNFIRSFRRGTVISSQNCGRWGLSTALN